MRAITKKTALLAAGVAVAVATGGVAYAYWTNSGSGTGSASTGTNSSITVKQTSVVSNLAPGLAAQPLAGNFDNGNSSPVFVQSVTVSVVDTTNAGCTAADYTLTQPTAVNAEVAAGNAQGSWSGGSIVFKDDPANSQDACKNVTVHLSYSSN
jgi:hypothetical protein